jgi:class 3 adenylate cyclase
MSQTRRLAAILAADVAGYSRLMGEDEEGTHERLKTHLRALIELNIAGARAPTSAAPFCCVLRASRR